MAVTSVFTDSFYAGLPVFADFRSLMDASLYTSLPDDWLVGVADIVQSTQAIAERRYKAVNTAGAAVIAAVTNALEGREFPFVFGGDGASFAVPPHEAALAMRALSETAAWTRKALDLTMRAAIIPLATIRAKGLDIRVARYAPSPNVSYAMFAGGGLAWCDAAMKRGEFAAPPATGEGPDLTGLSCRFEELPSARGVILSVVIVRREDADALAYANLVEDVIHLVEASPGSASPVPAKGPDLKWPPAGIDLEAHTKGRGPLPLRRVRVMVWTLLAYAVMRSGIRIGNFDPAKYIRQVVENSDFRKYDDALRMVLDCSVSLAADIEQRLQDAAAAGIIRYGLHRQDAAMMTCFTPSPARSDHVHFIDGARGGYAAAAAALKASRA